LRKFSVTIIWMINDETFGFLGFAGEEKPRDNQHSVEAFLD